MLVLAGQSRGGDKGLGEENIFCENSANRSFWWLLSALGGEVGRVFVEIKILDQNLTLLK